MPLNSSSYINLDIIKPPYLNKIPKSTQFYLKAYIDNSRGTISDVAWTQISPSYTKVTNNVYTLEYNPVTNEPYNTQLTLKMRMTAFTYISEVTSIKIMLQVTNSYGDVATELTEFYINSSPTIGTITQQLISGGTKPNSGTSVIRMRTNGWQDNIDDIGQTLSFMCYYKYDGNYFVLKDAGNLETFDITVPYISTENSGTRVTISLCILAYDKYLASSKSCIDLKNVMVTYSETTLLDFIAAAELADMSDNDVMLYTAASLEVLIPKYFRSPVQPHICTVDFQCYNGKCFLESGSNYCKCDQGYFGTN